jgi:hypothetical protein
MTKDRQKVDDKGFEKEKGRSAATMSGESNCRCKETAEMTPRELLRRMMNDLAFWKKEKKGQER